VPRPNPGRIHLPAALIIVFACTTTGGEAESWAAEWNARVDAAEDIRENPCGDFVFAPWAESFLAECERPTRVRKMECDRREAWVRERSLQCSKWREWVLRDRNRSDRQFRFPEPEVRVR
jgi:hypothetical protein